MQMKKIMKRAALIFNFGTLGNKYAISQYVIFFKIMITVFTRTVGDQ